MRCLAPRPRFKKTPPAYPACPGPDGDLHKQCPWCRKRGRSDYFAGMGLPGALVLETAIGGNPKWTDLYDPAKTQYDVNPLAARRAEVRALLPLLKLPLLKKGVATLVAGVRVTPRIMQYMSQLMDREIGLLTDTQGRGNLYLTLGEPTGVSTPVPKENYRFLAHTHPTHSTRKDQITRDMRNAGDDAVEIVITMDGLILFFSEGKYYNDRSGDNLLPLKTNPEITLDTPLNVTLFAGLTTNLQRARLVAPVQQSADGDELDIFSFIL
jgi:hypothetical protein